MLAASVIVPAYDAKTSIAAAIESVQAQTLRDIEILIIDDASTDETAAVVTRCIERDPRVRLLRNDENLGPGAARNRGIAAARGEWMALLDADDRFQPERLQKLIALGLSTKADMVADNLLMLEAGSRSGCTMMFPPGWIAEGMFLDSVKFVEGNIGRPGQQRLAYGFLKPIIRRAFLADHGVCYDAARFSEDYGFYLRCLISGARWVMTSEAMYEYTIRPKSLAVALSENDLVILSEADAKLLTIAAATDQAGLVSEIERHKRSVDLTLSWFSFVQALRTRNASRALATLFRDAESFKHISGEGLRALPRALAKIARYS